MELAKIKDADQSDRTSDSLTSPDGFTTVQKKDLKRRKRVAEIFAEGCFSTAEDYYNAALVFQHGDVPEHFFQTFLWARKAAELGNPYARRLSALGADRYLVRLGKNQLFASQASKLKDSNCWCLQPVEPNFSDDIRKRTVGKSLKEALVWVDELNEKQDCLEASFCKKLTTSPKKGSIPGFW